MFWEAPASLKMMPAGVASNSQSIGSSALTVTPIVPKTILRKMQNVCDNLPKVRNLTHSPSKLSIDLNVPTNVLTKMYIFDIRLPQSSIFGNSDCAYLALGTKYLVPGNHIIR